MFNNCIMYGYIVVIPKCYRRSVLKQLHVSHPGLLVMKGIGRSIVGYPKIDK